MIAAHPDDENTALLAYFARGAHLRTGYLSLTRGEGGQNLIGTEQGALLGLLRTEELLAARSMDGAEQFFTRAIDYGYSKTPEEAFKLWGRDRILGDVVWVIRRFQPDVIVLRFSGTPSDGHGHHQASAILGREAFRAAADPSKFPEQLKFVKPWQAKRIYWNEFNFGRGGAQAQAPSGPGRLTINTGEFSPQLGYSFEEIAALSRSLHRSQGMGVRPVRGKSENVLRLLEGEPASKSVVDGVPDWPQIFEGGAEVAKHLNAAIAAHRPDAPQLAIPHLMQARAILAKLDTPFGRRKLQELDEAVLLCAGMWLDAALEKPLVNPGETTNVILTAVNRSGVDMELFDASLNSQDSGNGSPETLKPNQLVRRKIAFSIPMDAKPTQPYWLEKPPDGAVYTVPDPREIGQAAPDPIARVAVRFKLGSTMVNVEAPVTYRFVDKVYGELTKPPVIAPAVTLGISKEALVFPNQETRAVEVQVMSHAPDQKGQLKLVAPEGWTVEPAASAFALASTGSSQTLQFRVRPPAKDSRGELHAIATLPWGQADEAITVINYPHIHAQTVFSKAATPVVRADIRVLAKRVGYIMGSGDLVPEALRQLGLEVDLLTPEAVAHADLSRYDAIVAGVRAYNVRPDLRANRERLLKYVENGGTYIVQYNVLEPAFLAGDNSTVDNMGPYPFKIGRERVAEETAPVRLLKPDHPLLNAPNKITAADFEGWIQERGLYFATQWDPRYETLFSSNDTGEKPLEGGTLVAKYGKGTFVFTSYSWFRELPAGVPGAFRIFANLLSASKLSQ